MHSCYSLPYLNGSLLDLLYLFLLKYVLSWCHCPIGGTWLVDFWRLGPSESKFRIWYSTSALSITISQLSILKATSAHTHVSCAPSAGDNNGSGVPSQPDNQCSCPDTQLGHRGWSHLHPQQNQEVSSTGSRTGVKLARGSSDALKYHTSWIWEMYN